MTNQLNLFFHQGSFNQKVNIKLEIDVQPPAESGYEYRYLDFPTDYEVCHQDLSSNFALKIHALLCRGFLKGRDWYDFGWYVRQGVSPNLPHLKEALMQYGHWQDQEALAVDKVWLHDALQNKIESINWKDAAEDVRRFLKPAEQKSLNLWGERFFSNKLQQMT